ncbi:MAG: Unknown protein [uncultured Sulfurovum sp.]|uniref:DUF58 domain-containing protein n=1 Tax=uncultured Sulfurovum sp. TaxID=269237 RepID=A0A6S6TH16_9BACT|nr:MAG: Unknown protein [uncultured Sulfurovum sp.]
MDKFETIVLRAKEDVYTHLQGGNLAKLLGQGYDFSELRSYESSDDIRYISWINSAKSNELYVKKMHEERELLVHVSLLVDGRIVIGEKQALMTYILTFIAHSAFSTNNLFEASFSIGEALKQFESFKNLEAIDPMIKEFQNIEPLGLVLDYKKLPNKLLALQEQKSLFFVVGDFLDEVDLSVLAQKHELCVIMVRDRWEENPKIDSDVELVNPLSNASIFQGLSKKAITYYREQLKEHDEKLYGHFHQHNIKYVKVYDISEVFEKLEQLFYS